MKKIIYKKQYNKKRFNEYTKFDSWKPKKRFKKKVWLDISHIFYKSLFKANWDSINNFIDLWELNRYKKKFRENIAVYDLFQKRLFKDNYKIKNKNKKNKFIVRFNTARLLVLAGCYKALRTAYDERQLMLEKENLDIPKSFTFNIISNMVKVEIKERAEHTALLDTLDNNEGWLYKLGDKACFSNNNWFYCNNNIKKFFNILKIYRFRGRDDAFRWNSFDIFINNYLNFKEYKELNWFRLMIISNSILNKVLKKLEYNDVWLFSYYNKFLHFNLIMEKLYILNSNNNNNNKVSKLLNYTDIKNIKKKKNEYS